MKEHVCEYQESVLATGDVPVVISRCVHNQCPKSLNIVNRSVCQECEYRQKPTHDTRDFRKGILVDVPNLTLERKREAGAVLELMTKFCRKCKFYDAPSHTCRSCDCLKYESIEEKAVDATFHCPLKVW